MVELAKTSFERMVLDHFPQKVVSFKPTPSKKNCSSSTKYVLILESMSQPKQEAATSSSKGADEKSGEMFRSIYCMECSQEGTRWAQKTVISGVTIPVDGHING